MMATSSTIKLYPVEYPFGILSDVHGEVEVVRKIIKENPEITRWFCLGDVIDMFSTPEVNERTLDVWFSEFANVKTLFGNHEETVLKRNNLHMPYLLRVKQTFINALVWHIEMVGGERYLLCHATPCDRWEFINKDTPTRVVIDALPDNDDMDGTVALIIGHNHSQFAHTISPEIPPIWSVGAVKNGEYAVVTGNGEISLRKIVPKNR